MDEEKTGEHIDWLIQQGAHGIVAGGTSGEFIALSDEDRRRLSSVAVSAAAGRVPVVAGTGAYSTDATIALTRAAADTGADGAIVILPYYQRPTRAEITRHFSRVGQASSLPIMAYNNPANSAAPELTAQDLVTLYQGGSIQAVKSTFPTVHQVHDVRDRTDEGFRVFYGSFMAPLEALAGGAHGWISGILNVVVGEAVDLWEAMNAGDLDHARAAWSRILRIRRIYTDQELGPVSDLAIYRGILKLRGRTAGFCCAPLADLDRDQYDALERLLERIDSHETAGTQAER